MIKYLTYQLRVDEDGEVRLAAQVHQRAGEGAPMQVVREQAYGVQGQVCCLLHALQGGAEVVVEDLGEYMR